MSYLIDTHVFIWVLTNPGKIPSKVREILEDPENVLYISAVSFWEIAIKVRNGRLAPIGTPNLTMVEAAEKMALRPIALDPIDAATHAELEEDSHFDPFDRMLIWQAIQRDLILVSADKQFSRFKKHGLRTLWK